MKMKDYIVTKTRHKVKPSHTELVELQEKSNTSRYWSGSIEDPSICEHPLVDYSQLREELLD